MKKYSVIVPVYNRPNEVLELLESLDKQTFKNFDLVIVEDGSSVDCKDVVAGFSDRIDIDYSFKDNQVLGTVEMLECLEPKGKYMIFFDSDCIIPEHYFETLDAFLSKHDLDAFGGPDAAHDSFTNVQKAINYAMTSIITTGGVRGKENNLDTYQPRTFNMGIKREVYEKVGGFSDIHPGEDPDWSYRIMNAGYKVGLVEEAFVYHKRRIDFSKFIKQVYKFGLVRTILIKWYPDKFKITYLLPSIFLIGCVGLIILSLLWSSVFLWPIIGLAVLLFVDSLVKTKSILIAPMAVLASFIQLFAYGYGFLKGWFYIHLLKREERKTFSNFFFKE